MNDLAEKLARAKRQAGGANLHCSPPPPFPLDALPALIRQFVRDGAKSLNVAPDFIALPTLGFAGGTIGNTRALAVKRGWIERPNPWFAPIGPPGSGKSPALALAQSTVKVIQHKAMEDYRGELEEWQAKVDEAKSNKDTRDDLPERPRLAHFYTTDSTIEGLVGILEHNAGVTVVRDELTGLVRSFDAYRKGADREAYLSLWAGSVLKVDRRGSGTTYAPRPCVTIVGGIQPDLFADLAEAANRRDGFVERFLPAEPAAVPQRWTDDEVNPDLTAKVVALFGKLRFKHQPRSKEEAAADVEQGVVFFSLPAKRAFSCWVNDNYAIVENSTGIAQGCYSKYPGQVARIALILHCLEYPDDITREVGVDTVHAAIEIIEYFRDHLANIAPRLGATGSTRSAGLSVRVLRNLDKHHGEWVSRSDLHRGLGNSVSADELIAALNHLVEVGSAELRTVPTGARPREEARSLRRTNEDMKDSTDGAVEPDEFPFQRRSAA